MSFLSLYIDKYYIVGTKVNTKVSENGSLILCDSFPLKLSNNEDRIWLYFYEDTTVDRITYSHNNKKHCEDREHNYISGCVFDNIVNKNSFYNRYQTQKSMISIFEDSGIFQELKENLDKNPDESALYFSFSRDVKKSAQLLFIQELKRSGFTVKQHLASIERLALEKCLQDGRSQKGNILILSAYNENLHISLFREDLSEKTKSLEGKGVDIRKSAIVTLAIKRANKGVLNPNQAEEEKNRLLPLADEWLNRLDSSGMPVKLKFAFSQDLNTSYEPQILKRDVEDNTKELIRNLSDYIHKFVSDCGVMDYELAHIVFLGDIFKNNALVDSIRQKYSCGSTYYSLLESPSLVCTYTKIDCTEFEQKESEFRGVAENELHEGYKLQEKEEQRQAELAKSEEERRKNEEIVNKRRELDNLCRDYKEAAADKRWQEAIDKANEAKRKVGENDLDYSEKTKEIDNDIDEYQRKKAEQEINNQIFYRELNLAKEFEKDGNFEEASEHAKRALEIDSQSSEARRIVNSAKDFSNRKEKVKDCITRATLLQGQKNFDEALNEVEKGLRLDEANEELLQLKNNIGLDKIEFDKQIDALSAQLDFALSISDYDESLNILSQLIEIDNAHSSKWFDKKNDIRLMIKEKEEFEKKLRVLRSELDFSYMSKDWSKVVSLANDYLNLQKNDDILKVKREAEERLEEECKKAETEAIYSNVDSLIGQGKLSDAEVLIKNLQSKYPDEREKCKKYLARIFDMEDEMQRKKAKPVCPPASKPSKDKVLKDLWNDLDEAYRAKNWKKTLELADRYLEIQDSANIRKIKREADTKLNDDWDFGESIEKKSKDDDWNF